MIDPREPIVTPVPVEELRPTQITVGMREVALKRQMIREQDAKKKTGAFLGKHMVPVVLGPKNRNYVTDHHHLARALLEEGVKDVLVTVISDLSALDKDTFLFVLDNRGWMHPFDENGRRRDYSAIPKTIGELVDDPYRSIAGELRRQAASPRTRHRSANSSGLISCAAASKRMRLPRTSTRR
jgi:hypothetical protein